MARLSRPPSPRFWGLLGLLLAGSCSVSPDASRAAWLQATLVEDNWGDLARDPALVEAKFAKMDEDAFAFARGTLAQFRRDLEDPIDIDTRSRFLTTASTTVQIVGDPHLENIGTFRLPSGDLAVEFNDFDAGAYGPYHSDLWRLAASWCTFGATTSFTGLDDEDWGEVAEASARGYAEEIAALAVDPERALRVEASRIFSDLLDKAAEKGDEGASLERFTAVDAGDKRGFAFDEVDSAQGAALPDLARLTPQEKRWIESSLPEWIATLPLVETGALKDAARRYGAGVASIAVRRYYLLFEGPTAASGDDLLIEWKESRDPILLATNAVELGRLFHSNGERVTILQRRAHQFAESDVFAGWVGQEPWSFRSRSISAYHQGLDRDRIVERLRDGRLGRDDLIAAANVSGQLLAHSHANGATLQGARAAPLINAAIGGDIDGFAAEARSRAEELGKRSVDDYRLFQLLLEERGPRLGYRQ